MMTFEEAFARVFRSIENPTEQQAADMSAEIARACRVHQQVFDEAKTNPEVMVFINTVNSLVQDHLARPQDALMTMFCAGLQVGIEMERQELPKEIKL